MLFLAKTKLDYNKWKTRLDAMATKSQPTEDRKFEKSTTEKKATDQTRSEKDPSLES